MHAASSMLTVLCLHSYNSHAVTVQWRWHRVFACRLVCCLGSPACGSSAVPHGSFFCKGLCGSVFCLSCSWSRPFSTGRSCCLVVCFMRLSHPQAGEVSAQTPAGSLGLGTFRHVAFSHDDTRLCRLVVVCRLDASVASAGGQVSAQTPTGPLGLGISWHVAFSHEDT